jgi:hypothetical protein
MEEMPCFKNTGHFWKGAKLFCVFPIIIKKIAKTQSFSEKRQYPLMAVLAEIEGCA